ncbi:hypothetical protein CXB51_033101 [Gossypium anomalum]|uniref:Small ribosomal subunit protein uS15 N-terminal domain-containing protein n=1 Tax=Gossypium anomalum TaxID=47600 RepID=A0A8J6CQI7_9ROSI|nr:hypothetical protein CXB51_033101 [Gossypium anomalum]
MACQLLQHLISSTMQGLRLRLVSNCPVQNFSGKGRNLATTAAAMGRMHSRGKGISASALPYKRTPPSWLKISSQDVEENICKFAKKGLTPSQIGVILRDSHGIAQVKSVTGSKILRILKAHGLAPEIPEDLYHLIKKAVAIRKHLERNRKDKDSKFRLILVESRIHRLARYYKKTKKLPPVWKYWFYIVIFNEMNTLLDLFSAIHDGFIVVSLRLPAPSLLRFCMWIVQFGVTWWFNADAPSELDCVSFSVLLRCPVARLH